MAVVLNSYRHATAGGTVFGPISFVGSGTYTQDGQAVAAGPTFNFSSLLDTAGGTPTTQANDFCIATWCTHNGVDQTITTPTGFTKLADLYVNDGQDANFGVFYKLLDGSETSIVFDHSGDDQNALSGCVMIFRGVDITNHFDVTTITATGIDTGQPNPGAITPVTPGSWIVVACGSALASTGVYTNPGDLSSTTNHFRTATSADSNPSTAGIGIKTNWSSGAFDPAQWGGAGTQTFESWAAVTMALRSA